MGHPRRTHGRNTQGYGFTGRRAKTTNLQLGKEVRKLRDQVSELEKKVERARTVNRIWKRLRGS